MINEKLFKKFIAVISAVIMTVVMIKPVYAEEKSVYFNGVHMKAYITARQGQCGGYMETSDICDMYFSGCASYINVLEEYGQEYFSAGKDQGYYCESFIRYDTRAYYDACGTYYACDSEGEEGYISFEYVNE